MKYVNAQNNEEKKMQSTVEKNRGEKSTEKNGVV